MSRRALPRRVRPLALVAAVCVLWGGVAGPVSAQESMTDVLTVLMTNRSIPTGDFVRDEQAAVATRDILARFLTLELGTVPVSPSSGGFTYRLDPTLGTVVRSSESFGPFFAERSLTAGRLHVSTEVSELRLGDLGRLAGTTQPHPSLAAVDTIRLTGVEQTTDRVLAVAGVRWNVTGAWLVTANVPRAPTEVGLNDGWVTTLTVDYAFGG
jgi:hypothetical protein